MKVIEFEDRGQDFLRWNLDDDGTVLKCLPFQGWVWERVRVVNHAALSVGGKARYVSRDLMEGPTSELMYRIVRINVYNSQPGAFEGGQYYSRIAFREDGVPCLMNADGTRSIFCGVDA